MQPNLRRLSSKACIIFLLSGNPPAFVGEIPVPPGFHRVRVDKGSFGAWLRDVRLKKDRTVYLYDGSRKPNQDAQFAVLDISVGSKDLQQCADAVMRLRSEFLYSRRNFDAIDFYTEQGTRLNFGAWMAGRRFRLSGNQLVAFRGSADTGSGRVGFMQYLETVFSYCGTRTLEKQLIPVTPVNAMHIGDVFIKGGSPGHTMIVMDMAEDAMGHRVYLLAQSYMPAQDIHIVINPSDHGGSLSDHNLSPWYRLDGVQPAIETPEWTFYPGQLRTWPAGRR